MSHTPDLFPNEQEHIVPHDEGFARLRAIRKALGGDEVQAVELSGRTDDGKAQENSVERPAVRPAAPHPQLLAAYEQFKQAKRDEALSRKRVYDNMDAKVAHDQLLPDPADDPLDHLCRAGSIYMQHDWLWSAGKCRRCHAPMPALTL